MKTYVHKKGIFSVFAIAAVMVAFGYIGTQWYLKNKIEDTTYEFNQASSLGEQKDRLLALQNTLVEIEPEIQKIDSYFVDPEEVIVFINDVEQTAKSIGLEIKTQSLDIEAAKEGVLYGDSLVFRLATTGTWQATLHFVELLETMPYGMEIDEVSVTKTPESLNEDGEKVGTSSWKAVISGQVLTHAAQ